MQIVSSIVGIIINPIFNNMLPGYKVNTIIIIKRLQKLPSPFNSFSVEISSLTNWYFSSNSGYC